MKSYIKALLYALCMLFVVAACEKNSSEDGYTQNPITTHDTIVYTINTDQGFSVADLKSSVFPDPKNNADFVVLVQRGKNGEIMSPMFSNPFLQKRFLLSQEFSNLETARDYFYSDVVLPEQPMQQFALNVKSNQVWLVQSAGGKFSKLLITDTRLDTSDITPHVEVDFEADNLN